jgi:hypothetical protein
LSYLHNHNILNFESSPLELIHRIDLAILKGFDVSFLLIDGIGEFGCPPGGEDCEDGDQTGGKVIDILQEALIFSIHVFSLNYEIIMQERELYLNYVP